MHRPAVSVVVGFRDCAPYLEAALRSALAQEGVTLEVVAVDDASADGSAAVAEGVARGDARLRVLRRDPSRGPGGPAAARNLALDHCRGEWVAVLDGDDLLLPDRLARLVARAEADGAEVVADDLLAFHEDGAPPWRLFRGARAREPGWVDAAAFVRSNRWTRGQGALGYLKPLFRRGALEAAGLRYDEALPVGEDADLLLRFLLARRASLRTEPAPGYLYRRHAASTSHRLADGAAAAALAAEARLRAATPALPPEVARELSGWRRSVRAAEAANAAIRSAKGRDWRGALAALRAEPGALPPVARAVGRLARRKALPNPARTPVLDDPRPRAVVVSRQRLEPRGNGSSAYLLAFAAALRAAGHRVELVSPSTASFGRRPVLRLDGVADVFDAARFRGGVRVGPFLVAADPRAAWRAALGVAHGLLRRAGLPAPASWNEKAPYAVGLPWTGEELLFVARHAARADLALADYVWSVPALPVARARRTAVVMHDLLSARAERTRAAGGHPADGFRTLGAAEEARLLARADLVLPIQEEEATAVRAMLAPLGVSPARVVAAPMAVPAVAAPQPGAGEGGLLFVGGAAAPNVDGLLWFLRKVWPLVRVARPAATLRVAGHVGPAALAEARPEAPWPGVALLGPVRDLAPLLAAADAVVSPLRLGSGLKIKLVDALAAGKAVVCTGVTLQGAPEPARRAVLRADDAEAFADACVALLDDPALRARHAALALDAARRCFSAEAAFGPALAALLRGAAPADDAPPAARPADALAA